MPEPPASLEEALQRLEAIARRLDEDEGTLEEALKDYEEGVRLARQCLERLDNAEAHVAELRHSLQREDDSSISSQT